MEGLTIYYSRQCKTLVVVKRLTNAARPETLVRCGRTIDFKGRKTTWF